MKRKRIGRYISFLVLFSLLTGLCTGLPPQIAAAQGEKELFATDWINFDKDTPEIQLDAEWNQELWADPRGTTLALKYAENEEDTGSNVLANQITAVKVKDGEEFKDDSTVTYHENERNHALTDFKFKHCGEYRICYTPDGGKESYISLHISLPEVGFYKTQTANEDTFISDDEYDLAGGSNEFYMILFPHENRTITFQGVMINWNALINTDDYVKIEAVSGNIYKIAVNPYSIYGSEGIDLTATCISTDNDNKEDTYETDFSTHLVYHTEKDLLWTDQFKEWGENGPEELDDGAEYRKESIWLSRPYDNWICLQYDGSPLKAEQLTVLDIQGNATSDASIRNGSKDGFIAVHTTKTGKYVLAYKQDGKIAAACEIIINLPDFGLYKTNTRSEDTLLSNEDNNDYEFQYGKYHNRTFYLLYGDEENLSISDVEFLTLLSNEEGEYEPKESDYVSCKPLAYNMGYEFTVKENLEEEFYIEVNCKKTYTWEDGSKDVYDDNIGMLLKPNGLKDEPEPPKTESPKVGTKLTVNGATYQVTSLSGGKREVSYVSGSKKAAKVTVPATITAKGTSYKVTAIADNAFAGNSKLTGVNLSNNITKIGKNAFTRCAKLSAVTVPKNVTEIGANAFKDCKKLSKVTFKGTKIKKIGKNAFKNVSKKITIKVPKSKKTAYKKLLKKAGYKKTVK